MTIKDRCYIVPECVRSVCAGPFFGRLLISLIFLVGAFSKIFNFSENVNALRAMGVMDAPQFYIVLGLVMELVGGILLLLGLFTRVAVYILMIFLLPTTFIFHSFWQFQGPEIVTQFSIFLRNLAIYGGLLLVWSYGPGYWSIDAHCCKKKHHP